MSSHLYLVKDDDRLISHCTCKWAWITYPPQMGCPWCGCGWLFSCIECRKAFTFAKAIETEVPWTALGRRDLKGQTGDFPEPEKIADWVRAMEELHADVRLGQRYVVFDGRFVPADAPGIDFEGWHARHRLDFVPQVAALTDPSVKDDILSNPEYWASRALPSET